MSGTAPASRVPTVMSSEPPSEGEPSSGALPRGAGRARRRALAEDVGSGDVTTQATVAEQAQARALITQKAPGVIYGLRSPRRVFARARSSGASFERLVAEGVWREQGGPVLAVEGARAGAADGRAHGAELPRAPLRRRDDGGARGARGAGHRRAGARHAQDDPRPARRSRRRRWRRAARATTAPACTTRS